MDPWFIQSPPPSRQLTSVGEQLRCWPAGFHSTLLPLEVLLLLRPHQQWNQEAKAMPEVHANRNPKELVLLPRWQPTQVGKQREALHLPGRVRPPSTQVTGRCSPLLGGGFVKSSLWFGAWWPAVWSLTLFLVETMYKYHNLCCFHSRVWIRWRPSKPNLSPDFLNVWLSFINLRELPRQPGSNINSLYPHFTRSSAFKTSESGIECSRIPLLPSSCVICNLCIICLKKRKKEYLMIQSE